MTPATPGHKELMLARAQVRPSSQYPGSGRGHSFRLHQHSGTGFLLRRVCGFLGHVCCLVMGAFYPAPRTRGDGRWLLNVELVDKRTSPRCLKLTIVRGLRPYAESHSTIPAVYRGHAKADHK